MAKKINKTRIPAVVVGAEVNGPGVVRSLAQAGVPVIAVDTTLRHAAMWSRWSKRYVLRKLSGRTLIDGLLTLQQELGTRPVLLTDRRDGAASPNIAPRSIRIIGSGCLRQRWY